MKKKIAQRSLALGCSLVIAISNFGCDDKDVCGNGTYKDAEFEVCVKPVDPPPTIPQGSGPDLGGGEVKVDPAPMPEKADVSANISMSGSYCSCTDAKVTVYRGIRDSAGDIEMDFFWETAAVVDKCDVRFTDPVVRVGVPSGETVYTQIQLSCSAAYSSVVDSAGTRVCWNASSDLFLTRPGTRRNVTMRDFSTRDCVGEFYKVLPPAVE